MSQASKILAVTFLAVLLGSGGIYLWQMNTLPESLIVSAQEEKQTGPIQHNCELSGGSFSNGNCTCQLEGEQTQAQMYNQSTGYWQSTMGGPAGDAFPASVGLPWGEYSFWTDVVGHNCAATGGEWLNAQCTCSGELTYNTSNGFCQWNQYGGGNVHSNTYRPLGIPAFNHPQLAKS